MNKFHVLSAFVLTVMCSIISCDRKIGTEYDRLGEEFLTFYDVELIKDEVTARASVESWKGQHFLVIDFFAESRESMFFDSDFSSLERKYDFETAILSDSKNEFKRAVYGEWIEPHFRPIKKAYIESYRGVVDEQKHVTYCIAFLRERPRVIADKTLFGVAAGEDLGKFFYIPLSHILSYDGTKYTLKKLSHDYYTEEKRFESYYKKGTMMLFNFYFATETMPEELTEGETIHLTFTFPLTFEHYWSYALARSKDANAVIPYEDRDMIIHAKLMLP